MPLSRRSSISIAVFVLLAVFVGLGYWYESREKTPGQAANTASIDVTSGNDRGPGSLREALFKATAADTEVVIALQVPKITLASTLPPLANAHGIRLVGDEQGTEIDGSTLSTGAVLDVAGANVSIENVRIRDCKATGIVLRGAERFKLQTTTIESCDVGVDVAENSNQIMLERNRFANNRVGVRFAASNRNAVVVKNEFSGHRDAGLWAVRSEPDNGGGSISIRDNRFSKERIGILTANVSVLLERNELLDSQEAAMQLMGTGAVARGNRISRGAAMGIVAENARGVVIEDNEFDGLAAYGIMLKGSADTLVRGNRIHNSGYGLAFVLGTPRNPSSAIDNTIIEPKVTGIDVIGDSPILRGNQVMRPRGLPLKVIDFEPEGGGEKIRSAPFLEGNNFKIGSATVAAGNAKASGGVVQR
ncbi:right-handed parallel beta-helix repeat-containing protein [Steroidobacter sp. S1-65]|uniref:Right-handed parallel beta-helix repeat-containing protein n=1 Tax=Steroidobacter gossypii TaxID=2805490 RepID=A0ABS1WYQ1_9GAMM|nr:right-handed parallel beta-helix repeat-containing protein [Steroidobacter gossypii]MBM0106102.1 right-handed parallel beta-helix repeat-containing protein [Steroidobacter gossypii]